MIRLPHFLTALFVAASALTAYPQSGELPVDILAKLNEKALSLFPDDARAQDKFVRDNESAYQVISYIPAEKGEEAELAKIKKRAEDSFPLDFVKQSEYIQNMNVGLSIINGFSTVFTDKEEFKKLKTAMLAANPDDYMKASKDFEQQAISVIEISMIEKPEVISPEVWDAFKVGLTVNYKGNYTKQKELLTSFSEKMMRFYAYEEAKKAEESYVTQGPSQWERKEALKQRLSESVLMIQNDQALGFITQINGKDVIIFPSEVYDARGISVTNKLDERIMFGEVFACKDVPVFIAFVKDIPEGVKTVKIADEAFLRSNVNKESIVYTFEMRNDYVSNNKLSAIGSKYLNLSTRLMRTVIPGSVVMDEEGSAIMGMVVNQANAANIGTLSNQEDAKHLVRQLKKEILTKLVVRLDKMENWERIDPQVYLQQSEVLKTLSDRNEQYLTLFTTTRFSTLEDKDVFRSIYEKVYNESRNKYERTGQERMVRDMLSEIAGNMKREVLKINPSQMYVSLQESVEFNLQIRQKMIETIENAIKNKTYMSYYFDDMKPKGR